MKIKMASAILFWCTLISLPVSFSVSAILGETEIFSVLGIIRYSWVMLLFIPIGICSFIWGLYLKKKELKFKKNTIVALICVPLLIVFGSFRFFFWPTVSYDAVSILEIENKLNIDMPDNLKIATHKSDGYKTIYAHITDNKDKERFEDRIRNDSDWADSLNPAIKGCLPQNIQLEVSRFDHFLIYNENENSFEESSFDQGGCSLLFIAYNINHSKLIILDDYKVELR